VKGRISPKLKAMLDKKEKTIVITESALRDAVKQARREALTRAADVLKGSADAPLVVSGGEWTSGYETGFRDAAHIVRALATDPEPSKEDEEWNHTPEPTRPAKATR
jgi:hypothetical protein